MNIIAIHKSFDKSGLDGKRKARLWTYNGREIEIYEGNGRLKFLQSLKPGQVVRATQVHATDQDLFDMEVLGVDIQYAHWHSLGFDKGMEPATLVAKYHAAPDDLFRSFAPRRDMAKLRSTLAARNALAQCYGDALRRIKQVGRIGASGRDDEGDGFDYVSAALDGIKNVKGAFVAESGKRFDVEVGRLAQEIPECVLFNKIAGLDSWILSASVVSVSGGIERFENVASFWHYFGQHVVDGVAPKRQKGVPMSWSPEGRKICYLLGDVIIKGTDWGGKRVANPWRQVFDDYREIERAKHDDVCECKYKDGHSSARARRKVVKSVLKQFFLAAKDIPFQKGHTPLK